MKLRNEYSRQIDPGLYERTPKAVFAAIAVSLLANMGDGRDNPDGVNFEDMGQAVLDEWQILHDNGIVPQSPPRSK